MAQRKLTGNEIGAIKASLSKSFESGEASNSYYYYCAFLDDFANGDYGKDSIPYAKNAISSWNKIYSSFTQTLPIARQSTKQKEMADRLKDVEDALTKIMQEEMKNERQYAKTTISKIKQKSNECGKYYSKVFQEIEEKYKILENSLNSETPSDESLPYSDIIRFFNELHYGIDNANSVFDFEINRIEIMQNQLETFQKRITNIKQEEIKDEKQLQQEIKKEISKIYNFAVESNGVLLSHSEEFMKNFTPPSAPSAAITSQMNAIIGEIVNDKEFLDNYMNKIAQYYTSNGKTITQKEIEQIVSSEIAIKLMNALRGNNKLNEIFNKYYFNSISSDILEEVKANLNNAKYNYSITNNLNLAINFKTKENLSSASYYNVVSKLLDEGKQEEKKHLGELAISLLAAVNNPKVNLKIFQEIDTLKNLKDTLNKIVEAKEDSSEKIEINKKNSEDKIHVSLTRIHDKIQIEWSDGQTSGTGMEGLIDLARGKSIDNKQTEISDTSETFAKIMKDLTDYIGTRKKFVTDQLKKSKNIIDDFFIKKTQENVIDYKKITDLAMERTKVFIKAPTFDEVEAINYLIGEIGRQIGTDNNKNDVIKITYAIPTEEIAKSLIKELKLDKHNLKPLITKLSKLQQSYIEELDKEFTKQYRQAFAKGAKHQYQEVTRRVETNMNNLDEKQKKMTERLLDELADMLKFTEEQLKDLKDNKNKTDILKKFSNELMETLFLSETMKTSDMNLEPVGFGGGSLGADIVAQLNNINDFLLKMGVGVSNTDLQWIAQAIINMSNDSLYSKNGNTHRDKDLIEKFFGVAVALAMFDEGDLELSKIMDQTERYVNVSSPNILHMYKLNGIYYPGSYILYLTLQELKYNFNKVREGIEKSQGARIDIINKMNSDKFLTIVDKTKNSNGETIKTPRTVTETDSNLFPYSQQTAFEEVHIQAAFLASILATLKQVQSGFHNIQYPV